MTILKEKVEDARMNSEFDLRTQWTIFFQKLEISYTYREKVKSQRGLTIPNFYLPKQDCFIITQIFCPFKMQIEDIQLLAKLTGKRVYVFYGKFPLPTLKDDHYSYEIIQESNSAHVYMWDEEYGDTMDEQYLWCECPTCHSLGICFSGWTERLPCGCIKLKTPNTCSPSLLSAYAIANKVRFNKIFKEGKNISRSDSR